MNFIVDNIKIISKPLQKNKLYHTKYNWGTITATVVSIRTISLYRIHNNNQSPKYGTYLL